MTIQKVNAIRDYLNVKFVERADVVDGLLTALVANVHILLIGPPGSAKSAVTVELAKCIDGANYFQWLLTKFSAPEELFGPYDLAKLKAGLYERIVDGKLPTAHIAYLDEIFKANSAILNALLTLVNERIFYNGTRVDMTPLKTLIGTSNEYPQEEELQAVFDRFLLRYEPSYVAEERNFAAMLNGTSTAVPAPITLAELEGLQHLVGEVAVDQHVIDAILALRADLMQAGILLSDRRWMQVVKQLLPARAVLAGRDHIVFEEDAEILEHALWADQGQKSTVATMVRKRVDPVAGKVTELVDDALDVANQAMQAGDATSGAEAIRKLKAIAGEIQGFIASGGSSSKLQRMRDADARVQELLKGVSNKCLGISL